MKTVLYTCLFLAVGVLCSAEKVFTFERRLKTNDAFQCRILTDQSIRYSFQLRGREQPVTRLETIQASFNGYIQVLSLNEQGNASSIRIRMDMAHGSLNGKPLKVSSGKNILIRGDLSGRRSSFRREDGVVLSSGETALLQALFPPASPLSLSDLTGKKRVLPLPGQSWKIVPDPFLHHLAERQIHLGKSGILGGVTYQGESRVGTLPCHRFVLRMETHSLKEYDFRLKVTFCMGESSPVPLKMKREAKEILSRLLPGDDPLSGGSRVDLHTQDLTEQWLIPVRNFPGKIHNVPSGNVSSRQGGSWKDLLR